MYTQCRIAPSACTDCRQAICAAVQRVLDMSEQRRSEIGAAARAAFLEERARFVRHMEGVRGWLLGKASALR